MKEKKANNYFKDFKIIEASMKKNHISNFNNYIISIYIYIYYWEYQINKY